MKRRKVPLVFALLHCIIGSDLFGVQIFRTIARDMLCEAVCFKSLPNRFENDLFQCALRMFAELTRVRMMAVRHDELMTVVDMIAVLVLCLPDSNLKIMVALHTHPA